MKLKMTLSSRAEAEALRAKLAAVRHQLPAWQAVMVPKLANEIVLDAIQNRMEAARFSKRIIDNTYISKVEMGPRRARIHVRSEYFSESGFDVALAREEGTTTHWVEPKVLHPKEGVREGRQTDVLDPDAPRAKKGSKDGPLVFATGATARNPESKQAPQALSWLEDGERRFSRGHMVTGIIALRIVANTIREKTPVLQRVYRRELLEWIEKSTGGYLAG